MATAASEECAACIDMNNVPAPKPIAVSNATPRERRKVAGFCFGEFMASLRDQGRQALLFPGSKLPAGCQAPPPSSYVSAPSDTWKLNDKDVIERSEKGQGEPGLGQV